MAADYDIKNDMVDVCHSNRDKNGLNVPITIQTSMSIVFNKLFLTIAFSLKIKRESEMT